VTVKTLVDTDSTQTLTDKTVSAPTVVNAAAMSGANGSVKIAAALAVVQALGGGMVDAKELTGAQTISVNMWSGITVPNVVVFGPSTWSMDHAAVDQVLPSNTTIIGHQTVFQHSAVGQGGGTSPDTGYFNTVRTATTGTISAAANSLVVASATNIDVGDLIAVIGLGAASVNQTQTISDGGDGINDSQTTIGLNNNDGLSTTGTHYFLIENEIVSGTLSGTTLTVTRGALGTTPASHSESTTVAYLFYTPTRVTAVSGTTITIDGTSALSVTSAPVLVGSSHIRFEGTIRLDGRQDRSGGDVGSNPGGIRPVCARDMYVGPGVAVENFDHFGVILDMTWDSQVYAGCRGNGRPSDNLGFDILVFRQSNYNKIAPAFIVDGAWAPVSLDDRTSNVNGGQQFEGICSYNRVDLPPVSGHPVGLIISGGNYNQVYASAISSVTQCVSISASSQWPTAPTSTGNTVEAGSLTATSGSALNITSNSSGAVVRIGHIVSGTVLVAAGNHAMYRKDNIWQVRRSAVFISTTAASNVDTGETDLISTTLDAGLLTTAGEYVVIEAWGVTAANANNKTVKLYFGSTEVTGNTALGINNRHWLIRATIVVVSGTTQDAVAFSMLDNNNRVKHTEPTATLASSITVKVTGTSDTASGDVTAEGMRIVKGN
jgi:hypothetical protein